MVAHPIVERMRPSPEQRPAVEARGCDVVVTAGAGTGKTRTLVARYLSLLADGLPLRSIVAITFTDKAAREMRARVRGALRGWLDDTDLPATERERWLDLYAGIDSARIGTIHSLCREILAAHPAEAGIDPRFQVLTEDQAALAVRQAIEATLAWAAEDTDAVSLFALLGEDGLSGVLSAMMARRLDLAEILPRLPQPLWPAWEALLCARIAAFVDDQTVVAGFGDLLALRANGTLDRAAAAGDKLAEPLTALLEGWDEIQAARAADDWTTVAAQLAPLRGNMKQLGRAANWGGANPKAIIKDLQAAYDEEIDRLAGKGLDLAADRRLAEAMPTLLRALAQAQALYDQARQARQALDFDDLEGRALGLLQSRPAVAAAWQSEVQALLVDEYQDTNARQAALIGLLDGGRNRRFLVGDAKQSIYRFRGADVTVFRQQRSEIAAAGGQVNSLDLSYRGSPALVDALNALLQPVLGEAVPEEPWIEPFAALAAGRHPNSTRFVAPFVELHLALSSKKDGGLAQAALALALRLHEIVEIERPAVPDDKVQGGWRALNYGDVAVLCRASGSFSAYEDAFERAGLPYLTVAGRGFYDRPEIRDLLNALLALADPGDDLALAGLLRSPLVGLSDPALFALLRARDATARGTLWACARAVAAGTVPEVPGLAATDAARLAAGVAHIATWMALAGRVAVADVLKRLIDDTGYQAALLLAHDTRAARNVAKLLADAHASGMVGTGEFLEYVQGLRASGTHEGEARASVEGAIQIMSVHKAKGLEFPIVVIGDAAYEARARTAPLIDPGLGLVLPLGGRDALPGVYRLAQVKAGQQEAAESARLLYVAATRAQEKLIISGCAAPGSKGLRLGGWLKDLGAPECLNLNDAALGFDAEGSASRAVELPLGSTTARCVTYEPGWAPESLASTSTPAVMNSRAVGPRLEPEQDGQDDTDGQDISMEYPVHPANPVHPVEVRLAPPTSPWPLLGPVAAQADATDAAQVEVDRDPPRRVWRVAPATAGSRAPAWVIGSLVHQALAAWRFPYDAAGPDFNAWITARAREYGLVDARQLADAARDARRLLAAFRQDPLYAEMSASPRRLAEVPYSIVDGQGRASNGSIDALYVTPAGGWKLVEFKTDAIRTPEDRDRLIGDGSEYQEQARRYVDAVRHVLGLSPQACLCLLAGPDGVETINLSI